MINIKKKIIEFLYIFWAVSDIENVDFKYQTDH